MCALANAWTRPPPTLPIAGFRNAPGGPSGEDSWYDDRKEILETERSAKGTMRRATVVESSCHSQGSMRQIRQASLDTMLTRHLARTGMHAAGMPHKTSPRQPEQEPAAALSALTSKQVGLVTTP